MRAVMLGGAVEIPGRPLVLPSLEPPAVSSDPEKLRLQLQRAMTTGAGVLRDAASLDETAAVVAEVGTAATDPEVQNLVQTGWALVHAARAREESRGAHTRLDHPDPSPAFEVRLVIR
jgi:L-aspartate oxidase